MVSGLVENKYFSALVLCLFIVVVFFTYNYDLYLFLRPQSVHFWRQTDSLSFISGYIKSGHGLFTPSVLNLQCGNGNSASEFPLFYYVIAQINFLHQHKEIALKSIYLLIYFTGLCNLYRLYNLFNLSFFFKISFLFLITSSTVLSYYACNVVPDICAFGFTLSGLYYFFLNKDKPNMKYTIAFLVCFSIASVTKIQFLLYPLTLLLSNSLLGFSKQSSQKGISRLFFQPLYIVPVLAICWYLYVINYNQTNCSTCFLTSIKPIWNLSLSEAHSVWIVITKSWYSSYYYPSTFHLIFLVVIICVVFFKKISLFNRIVLFLMFIGNAVYFILFYSQFNYHDYYFICFIPLIAFLFLAFNDVYLHYKKALNKYIIYALKTSLIVITVLSINYGRSKLVKRYKIVELGLETVNEDYYSLNSYLDEISVPSDALVISYPDHTCNATLYFMNRKGWTISETNFSKELIQKSIDNGAQYFVVNSSEVSNQVEVLGEVITNKVGQHGAIIIYRIEK